MLLAPSLNSRTPDELLAAFVPGGGTVAAIVCKVWAASQRADSANSNVSAVEDSKPSFRLSTGYWGKSVNRAVRLDEFCRPRCHGRSGATSAARHPRDPSCLRTWQIVPERLASRCCPCLQCSDQGRPRHLTYPSRPVICEVRYHERDDGYISPPRPSLRLSRWSACGYFCERHM